MRKKQSVSLWKKKITTCQMLKLKIFFFSVFQKTLFGKSDFQEGKIYNNHFLSKNFFQKSEFEWKFGSMRSRFDLIYPVKNKKFHFLCFFTQNKKLLETSDFEFETLSKKQTLNRKHFQKSRFDLKEFRLVRIWF